MDKNEQIKQTLATTRLRRKIQQCFSREIKLSNSKLNQTTKYQLKQLFLEAKWFYNNILSQDDIWNFDTKVRSVSVKVKDEFEDRQLTVLSSQMKQGLKTRIQNAIIALSRVKSKRGALKFKSFVKSIPLKQYGVQSFQQVNDL